MYNQQTEPVDILGEIFNKLNMGNCMIGQFFTPTHISNLMAKISGIDKNAIKELGYVLLNEPCCRSRRDDIILCKSNARRRI